MKDTLLNCYYDGMSIEQTYNFIEISYGKKPTEKQISNIKKELSSYGLKEWK